MAIVGPRPLLVRDMVFMSKRQRMRHTVILVAYAELLFHQI